MRRNEVVWQDYLVITMNEENYWDRFVIGDAVEGPAHHVSRDFMLCGGQLWHCKKDLSKSRFLPCGNCSLRLKANLFLCAQCGK